MPSQQQSEAMQLKLTENLEVFRFDLNDATTREAITQSYYDLLNADIDVQEFAVLCNDNNNTVESVNRGELSLAVAVKHNGDDNFTHYELKFQPTVLEIPNVEGDSN